MKVKEAHNINQNTDSLLTIQSYYLSKHAKTTLTQDTIESSLNRIRNYDWGNVTSISASINDECVSYTYFGQVRAVYYDDTSKQSIVVIYDTKEKIAVFLLEEDGEDYWSYTDIYIHKYQ